MTIIMGNDYRLEVFASTGVAKPVQLHMYNLRSTNIEDDRYKVIRGACWKIRNNNHCGVFENGEHIYTTEKVNTSYPNTDFELEYMGIRQPDIQTDKRVYAELIEYYIKEKLRRVLIQDKYRKYSCKSDITSKWIRNGSGIGVLTSGNREISLERLYRIKVEIGEDNYAYLHINTGSVFSSNLTVADYIARGVDPVGLEVKNDWAQNKQSGIVKGICDFTVTDPLEFGTSLKEYYIMKKEVKRVENIPDNTPAIAVEMTNSHKEVLYYPQALKPILTREKVGQIDKSFSLAIEKYVKRDMSQRLALDREFLEDIGEIYELDGLTFERDCCPVKRLGYGTGCVKPPVLICADNKEISCGEKNRVFNYGFYKSPEKQLKIGYLYPEGKEKLIGAVANSIYNFSTKGKFHNIKDKYIRDGLLDIQARPMIREEYAPESITDYKRAANKIKAIEGIDMVIALVPDGRDEEGPYNPFKRIWAEANIPSQMVSESTAKLFLHEKDSSTSKYYLYNIVLGILGKNGGIPWVLKDMPGNVDCFVGLDVATVEAGIHFPACSVVFDKFGRLLGFYKPRQPQKGEKITTAILQDIFDQAILSYEEKFGKVPGNIVIHRDGFSNEDDNWYEQYFGSKGISYTIVEVRKNIREKLVTYSNGKISDPEIGCCVYNKNKAYLVTTDMKNKKGSPNPILIEKKCGDIDITDIIVQILYLSQLHIGSTQKMRLPVTTGYADKICKNREFVPEGKVDKRLFFL